ncbi:amino acid adenylation domain-containing protein [Micromonospora sp. FIMYZ51]|uniref:non-ribosomal peptide synthetase n=1 Tax=Micromonospora sp. FIMYZ51 TaxID=3051832 RepID=UPI00311D2E0A
MSDARTLLADLEALGMHFWEEQGQLRFRGPRGVLTDERRALLTAHKPAILELLAGPPTGIDADPQTRHDPFPLTDVQSAYLLGRGEAFAFGGVGCHGYGEICFAELEPDRLETAVNELIARHDMLRAVVADDGTQRVQAAVPHYPVPVTDLREATGEQAEAALAGIRATLDHRVYRPGQWPLFGLALTRTPTGDVLHLSIDFLICDFASIQVLLSDLWQLYVGKRLPELPYTFRDYLRHDRAQTDPATRTRDRDYWLGRIDELPPAPELPRVSAGDGVPRFRRWDTVLDRAETAALRAAAGAAGISVSTAVLAAYTEVVGAWSRQPRFSVTVTLLDRKPYDPQVARLVGDFTSVSLLGVDTGDTEVSFAERAVRLQGALWADLAHRTFSGIEVIRELGRRRGAAGALMPIVFTSAIGLGDQADALGGELRAGVSQTPQVWIDCQNIERDGCLATNWDVREGVFPEGLVDDMFAAYVALLRALAADAGAQAAGSAWSARTPVGLPPAQAAVRAQVNDTAGRLPEARLTDGFVAQARRDPQRPAVFAGGRSYSYGELLDRSHRVAAELRRRGLATGDLVAVVLDRGIDQLAGVLGTLLAGGAYLPIDTGQPQPRRDAILADADVRWVLSDGSVPGSVAVGGLPAAGPVTVAPPVAPDDVAYVIYTSGSTGSPKGVVVSHRAAWNTIDDINERYAVTEHDRVLALASLGFDLSVYDIFGLLAVGGALVVPDPERHNDPSHWAQLCVEHRVTVWNSVPAQLHMLAQYLRLPGALLPALRLALLSGDWIPVNLPDEVRDRIPGLRVVGLGGATEAAIWSIAHPDAAAPPGWPSIPYGTPLRNQTFHVLDPGYRDRPDWVTGELFIGGAGLAEGYLGDAERTTARFVRRPGTGERLYRTGDLGRYRPGGLIEFLGREDQQVKIRGHRIELAEIESVLADHPAVGAAVVVPVGEPPLGRRLVAVVEPATTAQATEVDVAAAVGPAIEAADAVLTDVDQAGYLRYARALDAAALGAMLDTLRAAGLFRVVGQAHELAEVLTELRAVPRHARLVRRWLAALTEGGILTEATLTEGGILTETVGSAGGGPAGPAMNGGGLVAAPRAWALAAPQPEGLTASRWAEVDRLVPAGEARLAAYFRASNDLLPQLLRGEADPLALLFPGGRADVAANLYEEALFNRWVNRAAGRIVAALADQHPDRPLRILEVGAGAGGTTAAVLAALGDRPVDYLYTDLSGYFLGLGRQRFADRAGLRFAVLDLDADDPAGWPPGRYDVVLAGDVLHASTDAARATGRLRELLAPGGQLVFLEMTREHYQIMTSLEFLVRLDEAAGDFTDVRRDSTATFLTQRQWSEVVTALGGTVRAVLPQTDTLLYELGMHLFVADFPDGRAQVDPAELTAHLSARLPGYMVPADIVLTDRIPLGATGKVDRAALARSHARLGRPDPAAPPQSAGAADESTGEADPIAALWAEVLEVAHVGPDDDFFTLGGDSLRAAQLVGRMIETVPELGSAFFDELLQLMMESRTIRAFRAGLDGTRSADPPPPGPAVTAPPAGPVLIGGDPAGASAYALVPAEGGPDEALVARLGRDGAVYALAPAAGPPGYAEQAAAITGRLNLVGVGAGAVDAVQAARMVLENAVTADRFDRLILVDPEVADGTPIDLYSGDLTVLCAESAAQRQRTFWEGVCLGDVDVLDHPAPAAR